MNKLIRDPLEAAERLHKGALVALPTETVYGLAADAENDAAVRRVFEVKGRPLSHPLIVHLGQPNDADRWAEHIDPRLATLMAKHWPGPLTVIVPRAGGVSEAITGGQPTVALRVPDHPLTREVIAALGRRKGQPAAVVAPSANAFGQVSPTTAEHVMVGLGARLGPRDAVLDGGPCRIGVESTVVAVVDEDLCVLRPGAITIPGAVAPGGSSSIPQAPGTLASHYAPKAAVVVVGESVSDEELRRLGARRRPGEVALIAPAAVATPAGWLRLAAPTDAQEYAHVLYASLREADAEKVELVVAVPPPLGGVGEAVRDRLVRAAAGRRLP